MLNIRLLEEVQHQNASGLESFAIGLISGGSRKNIGGVAPHYLGGNNG